MSALTGRRGRAWVALAAFLVGVCLPYLAASHFAADDDSACGQISLVEHHPRVQFEGKLPREPLEHCALCHWQRAVSGASTTARVVVVRDVHVALADVLERTGVVSRNAIHTGPSRAPPDVS